MSTSDVPTYDDSDDNWIALPGGGARFLPTEDDGEEDRASESDPERPPTRDLADRKAASEKPVTVTVDLPEPAVRYTNERDGAEVARWGGNPDVPHHFEATSVWSSLRAGGEVEVGDFRLSLDDAETLALRILAAVHHERLALQRQADADLLAAAGGNGATHDWDTSQGMPRCRRCRCQATEPTIRRGQVPACSTEDRCRMGWHAITMSPKDDATGSCYHCHAVYPATAEFEERAR